MVSPGKKQFDLAEKKLLEIFERVALCMGWDGSQVDGDRMKNWKLQRMSLSQELAYKEGRGLELEWRNPLVSGKMVLEMGSTCACLKLRVMYSLHCHWCFGK